MMSAQEVLDKYKFVPFASRKSLTLGDVVQHTLTDFVPIGTEVVIAEELNPDEALTIYKDIGWPIGKNFLIWNWYKAVVE